MARDRRALRPLVAALGLRLYPLDVFVGEKVVPVDRAGGDADEGVTPIEGRIGSVRDSDRTGTVRPETLRPPARPVLMIDPRPADEATAPSPSDRLSRARIGLPPAAMVGDVARLRLMLDRTGDAGDAVLRPAVDRGDGAIRATHRIEAIARNP